MKNKVIGIEKKRKNYKRNRKKRVQGVKKELLANRRNSYTHTHTHTHTDTHTHTHTYTHTRTLTYIPQWRHEQVVLMRAAAVFNEASY